MASFGDGMTFIVDFHLFLPGFRRISSPKLGKIGKLKKNEGESNGLSGGKQNGWLFVIFMRFYSFPFFFDLLISLYLWVRIFLVYFLLLLFLSFFSRLFRMFGF